MDNKKQSELRCYEMTQAYVETCVSKKVRKYINSVFPICNHENTIINEERPDFVIQGDNAIYAVEHFMVDFCFDGPRNNQSQSKRANHDIFNIYKNYHDDNIGTIQDSDIVKATADIEEEINKIMNISCSFDYEQFVESFRRIFKQHYLRVEDYRMNKSCTNTPKVGFMIELHCDTHFMYAIWNGSIVSFKGRHRSFPLTKEIVDLFRSATNLDFVIVTQFEEGIPNEAKDVRLYEPRNMDRSISEQDITIYDKICYPDIKKKAKLEVEEDET